MTDYDNHLHAPVTADRGERECEDCDQTGRRYERVHTEDYGAFKVTFWESVTCDSCEGLGWIYPPSREEINERRAEERADE